MALPSASDNPFPSLLITEGSAPSSPAAGKQRLFIDSADHLVKVKNSSGTVTAVGGGGGATVTASEDAMSGDVTIVNNTTEYDGPSLTLAAGTWLVAGHLTVQVIVTTSQTYEWGAKLWDGSTIYGSGYGALYTAANWNVWTVSIPVPPAIITLGGSTTIKISGRSTRSSSASKIVRDDATFGLTAHKASKIVAYKVV